MRLTQLKQKIFVTLSIADSVKEKFPTLSKEKFFAILSTAD
jgi:hypothetical protein